MTKDISVNCATGIRLLKEISVQNPQETRDSLIKNCLEKYSADETDFPDFAYQLAFLAYFMSGEDQLNNPLFPKSDLSRVIVSTFIARKGGDDVSEELEYFSSIIPKVTEFAGNFVNNLPSPSPIGVEMHSNIVSQTAPERV